MVLDLLKYYCRPETQEEKKLKEKINQLKKELEEESTSGGEPAQEFSEQVSLHDTILEKERELEKLIGDLDDKVRFGQKETERPGSGAGRAGSFLDRPPSRSFGESRNPEFMDRPRSRGTGDQWSRPVDDRRGFQGGGESGFLGSRDLNRCASFDLFLLVFFKQLASEAACLTMNRFINVIRKSYFSSLKLETN